MERETSEAIYFLMNEVPHKSRPWVLWLNYLPPHFPLIAPEPYSRLYPEDNVDMPFDSPAAEGHPVVQQMREYYNMTGLDESTIRRARSAYYGLCTLIDDQVGRVMAALEGSGQADNTLIVYTSDHGDQLGDHELWWKGSMYETSIGVPLLMSGPAIKPGIVDDTPVSLVDLSATIMDIFGIEAPAGWRGTSLLKLMEQPDPERAVFSEYHAHGASTGLFMIRRGPLKLVHYEGFEPELFHLEEDPQELRSLAGEPEWQTARTELEHALAAVADTAAVDRAARRDQSLRREQLEERKRQ
ncbi:sulfatase-like hydrolase/transferase [Paenibacillus sp. CC-CFT747]|nr:sulfatase-like hydrolase/transferase [Paenibacillus sp. CC-CFT747]